MKAADLLHAFIWHDVHGVVKGVSCKMHNDV